MELGLYLLSILVATMVPDGEVWVPPVNELGEPCPWPFDPIALRGKPIGQFHCPYCGAMVLAGLPHIDYSTVVGRPSVADNGSR
jgi:hypothetical protein